MRLSLILAAVLLCLCVRTSYAENNTRIPEAELEADEKARKVIEEAGQLEAEWEQAKKNYHQKFSEHVNRMEAATEERKHALDYGDKERRDMIAEQINDLGRTKADMENELTELTAATGVNLGEIKGDWDRRLQDMKD